MKATVHLSFKDKETSRQYSIGQTFEGTSERIVEINKALKGALQIILEVETETIVKKRRRSKKE